MIRTAIAAPLLAALATAGDAATFDLRYVFSDGDVLTARIEGTLQSDGDTVLVTAVPWGAVDGAVFAPLPYIDSFSNNYAGGGAPAVLTLSGVGLDFLACDTALCAEGFGASPPDTFFPGAPAAFGYDNDAAGTQGAFIAANYSLSAVPLPGGAVLLLGAFAALGALRRRDQGFRLP